MELVAEDGRFNHSLRTAERLERGAQWHAVDLKEIAAQTPLT